jgi:hypothetical protein
MTQLDLPQLQRLLYLFVGATFVVLATLIVYLVVASRRQKTDSPSDATETVSRPASLPEGERVLSLVREELTGRLQVEIGGARYRRLSDVEDPEVKRKIVAMAMEMIQFTGVLDVGALEPASIEKTQTWREDLREDSHVELDRARSISSAPGSRLQPPPAPQEVEARFLSLLEEMGQAPAQPDRPNIVDSIQHRLQPKPIEPGRARTFVDDIDAILQRRVQLIPALAGRELHVRPGTGGKVSFSFEGKEYENVDDVPNLTARQLIKDAIQEWDEAT